LGSVDLFRQRRGRLERLGVVPAFAGRRDDGGRAAAYVVALEKGQRAVLAAIVETGRTPGRCDYRLTLHALRDGALVKSLELESVGLPWVTDLDDDGDAELITWGWAVCYPHYPAGNVLWPEVRTRVPGGYEVRTEQFAGLFGPVADALRHRETTCATKDPKVSDYLGRAYEMLGDSKGALEAYGRAERKYVARDEGQAAAAVRQRRLRLEGSSPLSPPQLATREPR
jgi:hypothetical protein